jgi:hypothetical protein
MTDLTTTLRPSSGTEAASAAASPAREPTLITEQQVVFSTAAAVALPSPRSRRWTDVLGSVAPAVRRAAGPTAPVPHHRFERYAYLGNALMAREMGRL